MPGDDAVLCAIDARALGHLALTGARFAAAEALRIGLVHRLCPADGLDAAAAGRVAPRRGTH